MRFDTASKADKDLFAVLSQFAYFSICIMTRTGYGDIYPRSLVARVLTSVQMITTVLVMVVVFGRGLRSFQEARLHSVIVSRRLSRAESPTYSPLVQPIAEGDMLPP